MEKGLYQYGLAIYGETDGKQLRTLINTVATDKLLVKGGRVVTMENTANWVKCKFCNLNSFSTDINSEYYDFRL